MLDWIGPTLSPREIWLKNRKNSIGASDVPIIMGVSPYKKAIDLYLDKISDRIDNSTNYAMELGNQLEPIAREAYEAIRGAPFEASSISKVNIPHFTCSLDGYNDELSEAIEIKYVGADFKKECPEKYYPQIQFQYYVSDVKNIDLVQINNSQEIHILSVKRDEEYITEMVKTVSWFWDCIVNKREDEVKPFSDNIYLTVEGITYKLGAKNLNKSLKLIKGLPYRLHKLYSGESSDYLGLCGKYGKKK